MAQAEINNNTACEVEALFTNDEQLRPLVAPIIKATFDIFPDGILKFSKEQLPVNLAGEHYGDPENSSYIYEPECVFFKSTTDVAVIGDAISTRGPVTHLLVEIKAGDLFKRMGVIGDRHWIKQSIGYAISDVTPFESIPLTYENAFGGWDKRYEELSQQGFEARNTVGKGFYKKGLKHVDAPMPLPNIENPDDLIQDVHDTPAPVGCGFTLPHWQPRAAYAGTYDQAWEKNRSPMLPKDFNRFFYNGASEGLIAPSYFSGNEVISISNMTAGGLLQFQLPVRRAPIAVVQLKARTVELPTILDTVIVNTRTMQLSLIWRNYTLLDQNFHDVESVDIHYG